MRGNNSGAEHKRSHLDLQATLRSTTALSGLAVAVTLMAAPVQAQQTSWTGAVSTDWSDASNWTDGVPNATDDVLVHQTTPTSTIINPIPGGAAARSISLIGTMEIPGGGVLNSGISVLAPTGNASFYVVSPGSVWNATDLTIGGSGSGGLSVLSGGGVNSVDTVMGLDGSGFARVRHSSSLWDATGDFTIGARGGGILWIDGDGDVTFTIAQTASFADAALTPNQQAAAEEADSLSTGNAVGPAALTAASSSNDTTFTTLGLRAETALPLSGMAVRLHGMLGWRHAFGDVPPTSDLAFAGGSAFTIAGVPIAEDRCGPGSWRPIRSRRQYQPRHRL